MDSILDTKSSKFNHKRHKWLLIGAILLYILVVADHWQYYMYIVNRPMVAIKFPVDWIMSLSTLIFPFAVYEFWKGNKLGWILIYVILEMIILLGLMMILIYDIDRIPCELSNIFNPSICKDFIFGGGLIAEVIPSRLIYLIVKIPLIVFGYRYLNNPKTMAFTGVDVNNKRRVFWIGGIIMAVAVTWHTLIVI